MLRDWAEGRVAEYQVHLWAQELYPSREGCEYEDWDENDESVLRDVLGDLDMLDMNLRSAEDVPIYLDFLATPRDQYAAGHAEYRRRLEAIDLDRRREQLKDVPYYRDIIRGSERAQRRRRIRAKIAGLPLAVFHGMQRLFRFR